MTRARTTGTRRTWGWAIWMAAAVLAVGVVAATGPVAQAAKAKAAAKKADTVTEADRTIETAISALEAGKPDLAIQEFTAAISGGKISQSKLARALYYRGLAYRKHSKPAQAIADFTSALWIKNGLDAQQRADALLNRAGAYRDAGLSDQAEADERRVAAAADQKGRVTAARAAPAPGSGTAAAQPPATSGGGLGGFFNALFGGSPASQEPVSQGFATSVSAPTDGGRQPARAAPAASVSAWSTQAGPTPVSRSQASPSRTSPSPAGGWGDSTVVRKVSTRQAAATPATTGSTGGQYVVQVAAVRSKAEAQAVAARLAEIGLASPGKREAAIEKAVMGNMGTLYQVHFGPFASTGDVESACPRLRKAGLDCLIVKR